MAARRLVQKELKKKRELKRVDLFNGFVVCSNCGCASVLMLAKKNWDAIKWGDHLSWRRGVSPATFGKISHGNCDFCGHYIGANDEAHRAETTMSDIQNHIFFGKSPTDYQ